MTLIQLVRILGVMLVQYSCMPQENNNYNVYENAKTDTCKSVISTFNYPKDIERLDSLNYICNRSELVDVATTKGERLILRFDDKNYSLFNYDFRTKVLFDKRTDLILCFKRSVDYHFFSNESIEKIYILSDDLMPLYSVGFLPQKKETVIEKFYYDRTTPQSYFIKMKKETKIRLEYLTYEGIVELSKSLKSGNYTVLNERGFCCESPHFKTTPYWTEN